MNVLLSHGAPLRVAAFAGACLLLLGVKLTRDKAARKSWDDGSGEVRRMEPKDYAPGGVLVLTGAIIVIACLLQPATWMVA